MKLIFFLAMIAQMQELQSIKTRGLTIAYVKFPYLSTHSVIRDTNNYRCSPWYDFMTVRIGTSALPSKVGGVIVTEGEQILMVHTTYVGVTPQDFVTELLCNFVLQFKLGNTDCI